MAKTVLTNEQYAKLLEAERVIHDVLPDLDKLEECGVECQAYREGLRQKQQQIEAIKQNFAPSVR